MALRRGLALAVLLATLAGTAAAQDRGFYVGLGAGLNLPADIAIDGGAIATDADAGYGGGAVGALGFAYGNGFRTELEVGYRTNSVDDLSGVAGGSGDVDAMTIMVNAYYGLENESRLTPYVGGGVGWLNLDFSGVTPVGGLTLSDNGDEIGYQGIAGVGYEVAPQVDLFAEYRYLGAFGDVGVATNAGANVSADYAAHSFMVGLRFSLTPPPAPPPAVEPEPEPVAAAEPEPIVAPEPEPAPLPGPYLVFFDWDKSDIRPDAMAILVEAAANAQEFGIARIAITGHADRSGSDAYNLALSQRRVAAVRAELVRLGIPENEITMFWRGESEPLVATEDGVREAKNRRVEIVYQ
ncbi:MAG: OmpA family protein [Alphaproteobacteria bacterium]|nr:OmpA family protein [Alphaproteobacteria bacterium]